MSGRQALLSMRAGQIASAQEAPCALSNAEPFEKAAGGGQLTHGQSVTAELLPSFSVRGFAQPKERAAVRWAARMRDGRGLPPLAALFINILLPSRGQRTSRRGQPPTRWPALSGPRPVPPGLGTSSRENQRCGGAGRLAPTVGAGSGFSASFGTRWCLAAEFVLLTLP